MTKSVSRAASPGRIWERAAETRTAESMNTDVGRENGAVVEPDASLEQVIGNVGTSLCSSFGDLLRAVPGQPRRPVELSKALRINQDLSSKILLATAQPDPFATASSMPGPQALRGFLRAASRRRIPKELVKRAQDAVDAFDDLLRHVGGKRSDLDAIVSTWMPEARQRYELRNKQLAFEANRNLKGVMTELALTTVICHPSAGAELRCDGLLIYGYIGLRCLRPHTPLRFSTQHVGPTPQGFAWETLNGEAAEPSQANILLREFCSEPFPKLDIRQLGDSMHYLVDGDIIGPDQAVNLFLAQVCRKALDRYQSKDAPRRKGVSAIVETPAKTLILDALLHEDVWPGSVPQLVMYDTAVMGVADVNDPSRQLDQLSLAESIQSLGQGTATLRIAEIPDYVQLIRHACKKLGWDAHKFRAYRCRIQYPVYGSQVEIVFDPPYFPGA